MKPRTISLLSLLGILLVAPACDSSPSSSDLDLQLGPSLFDPSALQGNWLSGCVQVYPNTGYNENSIRETLSFAGNTMTITDVSYSDSSCQTVYFTQQTVTTFTTGGAAPMNSYARTIDMTVSFVHVTPNSSQAVTDLNAQSMCGISSWSNGSEADISGRTCNGSPTASAGTGLYDIVQIGQVGIGATGYSDTNQLYLGAGASTSSASRPTALEVSFAYTRQ